MCPLNHKILSISLGHLHAVAARQVTMDEVFHRQILHAATDLKRQLEQTLDAEAPARLANVRSQIAV